MFEGRTAVPPMRSMIVGDPVNGARLPLTVIVLRHAGIRQGDVMGMG